MSGPIDVMYAAGFNDEEIATWAVDRRAVMEHAGFKSNEIDAYFTGGVVAPDKVPAALDARLAQGADAKKREGGLAQTLPQGAAMIMTPEGRGALWEAAKSYIGTIGEPPAGEPFRESEFLKGIIETLKTPADVAAGKIDLSTDEGMDKAIGLGTLIGFGRPSKLTTTGRTSGFSVQNGEKVARVDRGPMGEVHETPIGGMPTAEDFSAAAKAVGGPEAPTHVQEKLLRLYEDEGRLPAEVAHDALSDPVLAQRLLSRDPTSVPYIEAYHGSPHDFAAFDVSKIGAGEGAQAYGHGLYFAENPKVAGEYQKRLSGDVELLREKNSLALQLAKMDRDHPDRALIQQRIDQITQEQSVERGALYTVRVHVDKEKMLDWDKPIGEQSKFVQQAVAPLLREFGLEGENLNYLAGTHLLNRMSETLANGKSSSPIVSQRLRDAGIPGIKYLDQGSRPLRGASREDIQARISTLQEELRQADANPENFANDRDFHQVRDGIAEKIETLEHELKTYSGPTSNFVVFDDKQIEITHKNGTPVTPQERKDFLAGKGAEPPKPPEPPTGEGAPPEPPKPPPGSFKDAQQKVLDRISIGEREPAQSPWTFRHIYTQLIDNLYPLKDVSTSAYEMARLTRGTVGKAGQFLERGTFDFDTLKTNGKGFREIVEPVRNDLDGLRAYLAAQRALELEGRGIKSGFSEGKAAEGTTAPPLITSGLDAATAVVKEGTAKYGQVARDLVNYQNRLLDYLKKSGVVSERSFEAMTEANKNYVPFYRLIGGEAGGPKQGGKTLGPGNPLKKLTGSERKVVDPLESIIKNTYAYLSIADRNAAGIKLVDALKEQGFESGTSKIARGKDDAKLIDHLKEQGVSKPEELLDFIKRAVPEDGDTISAFRDGVREEVKVNDPDLVSAFRGLNDESVGLLVKVLAVPARTLRAGAVLTPEFMARNLLRDFLTAFVNTGRGIFTPFDTAKGLSSVLRQDAHFQDWVKGGGGNATMVALDRRYLQESLQKLTADTGLMTRSWNVVTSPLAGLRMMSELIENATRVGEFRKVVQGESKSAIQDAAFASREVTLDFARMGAKMRSYNMITAFANAQLQGVDRAVRAFADRPVNTTAKVAAGITLPSVLLWWANHEDQRYQELPAWQKDLFWIIPTDKWEPIAPHDAAGKPAHLLRERGGKWEVNNGAVFRIPKPFELGVIFGSGPERILEATIGQNKEAFDDFGKSVMRAILPNFLPTAAQPMFEQWANRSSFTNRTLIPKDVEKLLPEYQYTPYTTELSKKLGHIISAFPGFRDQAVRDDSPFGPQARALTTPVLIENYIRSWTGGLGMYGVNLADLTLRKAGILPDPVTPTPTLADIPFVKGFVARYPMASAKSIQDFYDDYTANKKYFDTFMAKARDGDIVALQHIQGMGGPMMFAQLDGIKETLTQHSKLVKDVYKNPQIPADEKRQLIDQLYYSMIQIGRYGKDAIRQMRAQSEAIEAPMIPAMAPLSTAVPAGKSNGAAPH